MTRRKPAVRAKLARLIALSAWSLQCACTAGIGGTHFLLAYNPDTGATNYYRVTVKGNVFASSAKHSSGQYDGDAINHPFGEGVLEREYLQSHLNILSASSDAQQKEQMAAGRVGNTHPDYSSARLTSPVELESNDLNVK